LDAFQNLFMGFGLALSPQNLMFAFIGCFVGTAIGVLPGIGPAATMAMLLPITFSLPPTPAIIMLCAIFYGAQYGGTITSVLMNVPGEASTAITCLDGYQMAKKGKASTALSIAALGSFFGGSVATLVLVVAAVPLARAALRFGPPESFALLVVGLCLVTSLGGKSLVKGLMMAALGLILAIVGIDPIGGAPRFTFDFPELLDGVGFIPVIMGMFGVSEILLNAEEALPPIFLDSKLSTLIPSKEDVKASVWPVLRGTGLGVVLGLIPGVTNAATSFLAYVFEKKMSKHPEQFGTGVIEGVAGPETANNAHANASFIPLLTLGIPATPGIAVIMGGFIINGLVPGPLLFRDHAEVAWTIIASMFTGNVILLILNLPLIGMWVKILKIPYSILFALILGFTVLGAYSVNNSPFDVGLMALFGVIGYVLKKADFPLAPVALTLILGPLMEKALHRSLQMSQGGFEVFLESPITITLLAIAVLSILYPTISFAFRRPSPVAAGDDTA
jgi:putative tricarboxylic transport membrane protein